MTVAAVIHNSADRTGMQAGIASVDIFRHMAEAETIWRRMETPDHVFTPFQRFDFLNEWQTHVGQHEGFSPFIVVGYDIMRRPLVLMPLGVRQENGAGTASFLGGKHATFNMPLLAADFAATAGKGEIEALLDRLRARRDKTDLLALTRQPSHWMGVANPFALLPMQPSVNKCPLLNLEPHSLPAERISNSFRRRLKSKERKLQALSGYRYVVARADEDIKRILDAFFTIKPQRMALQKLPNVFADPGVRDFVTRGCLGTLPDGNRVMEIHALESNAEVIAIFCGVADGHRFSMMFNTYTISESAKFSPGLILLRNIIDHYAELGYTSLDLGIGSDDYKLWFCKDDEPIFDSFLPLTMRGSIAALGLSSLAHAKRLVKQTPALAQMAQILRSALHR